MGTRQTEDSTPEAAQDAFDRGRGLLAQGDCAGAFEVLGRAHEVDPQNARIRAYYALAMAQSERRFESAVELCRSALKQEFFNPELYLVTARLHLVFGFKAEALRYLRRGQMIDPSDRDIDRELRAMGPRQRQILRFLPRRHPINRLLGRARKRLARQRFAV